MIQRVTTFKYLGEWQDMRNTVKQVVTERLNKMKSADIKSIDIYNKKNTIIESQDSTYHVGHSKRVEHAELEK